MDLDAYRRSAQAFLSELLAEEYRHYAGLKEDFAIEAVYERHGELFARGAVDSLRSLLDAAPDGSERRRGLRMLLEFAVDGLIGQATKAIEAELAGREASLSITVDGQQLGFRESAVAQANEPDPSRRMMIESARLALIDADLGSLYVERLRAQHDTARQLGFASYRDLCSDCKDYDLAGLHAQTSRFSAATEGVYRQVVEPALAATLGIELTELRRADLPRLFRACEQDCHYPAQRLVPSFRDTMYGLGIALGEQRGVVLDVEPRPGKSPRAFCAPVRVPGEVYLVIAPVGGRDDFVALFHEGGHAQHAAHVDPALPFEFRHLGDNAITEAFAFLVEHLAEDPEWLARRLGVDDAAAVELSSHARAVRLMYLRRYAAKLAYELELHGADADGLEPRGAAADGLEPHGTAADGLEQLADRYAALLSAALQIEWPREMFLADVDPGFYCSCYLRAWALETHLRAHLRGHYGAAWFESPHAGDELRALWREGQRLTPEELLARFSSQPLEFGVLLSDLGLA